MFNILISSLPFNPSLINQVSFYAKRLRKETAVRRLGVTFVVLAMLVQMFAIFSPPKPTMASSGNDMINGGIGSAQGAVSACQNNLDNFGTVLNHFSISCANVASAATVQLNSRDYGGQLFSMGHQAYGKAGETPVSIPGAGTLWLRYLWSWDTMGSSSYTALRGTAGNGQTFFILYDCGNLVFVGLPVVPPPNPAPLGNLDNVDCNVINGWAFDDSKPTTPISVHVYIDGKFYTSVTANQGRTDVGAAYSGRGNYHGFSLNTPASIKDTGGHTVTTYAIGIDQNGRADGINPVISTKSVNLTCKKPTPPPPPPSTPVCPYDKSIKKTDPKCVQCPNPHFPNTIASSAQCKPICPYNSSFDQGDASCKPCDSSQDTEDRISCLAFSKKAANNTQNISDANGSTAKAGDVITYTLMVTNNGKASVDKFIVQENINDILDYATVTDLRGGSKDSRGIISWPALTVKAGQTVQKQFVVKVKNPIPQTPVSSSDPGHFDLLMTNVYGNTINIKLPGTILKTTEFVTQTLPNTGPGTAIFGALGAVVIVGYFFARSRLLAKELDLVRDEYTVSGGI
ncbi:MAG: hypothetical protein WC657_04880 [Candidatus Paceibacterota bacterium]